MDSTRVEAYLRSICSVLGFDIGELWCCKKGENDSMPKLKFIQLHTSPNYKDQHSILIQPHNNEHIQPDEEVHRFSPVICRAICDGGQIVWSNTYNTEGLVGRSDLPLNTAVGMPVCSIDGDLYMLVLFAVDSIQMTPNAVDFLWTMTRAVTEVSSGFLPASFSSNVTVAQTDEFSNIWDVSALMGAYYNDVAFHLLPIGRMQEFFDYQEASSFRFVMESDMKSLNDLNAPGDRNPFYLLKKVDGFTCRPLRRMRSDSNVMSDISDWDMNMDFSDTNFQVQIPDNKTFQKAYIQNPRINVQDGVQAGGVARRGTDGGSMRRTSTSSHSDADSTTDSEMENSSHVATEIICDLVPAENLTLLSIDAREGYLKNHSRFHDFMIAALGMTVFDAAELWLLSDNDSELHIVAGMHRDGVMNAWTVHSREVQLKKGQDVPGQVLSTAQPYWEKHYDRHSIFDQLYPRATMASKLSVRTAFGVPLPGPHGASGVLAFYSRSEIEVDPFMVCLVLKAMQMISAGHVEASSLFKSEVQNVQFTPQKLLDDWLHSTSTQNGPSTNLSASEHSGYSCSADSTGSQSKEYGYATGSAAAFGGSGMGNMSDPNVYGPGSGSGLGPGLGPDLSAGANGHRQRITHAMRHKKKKSSGAEMVDQNGQYPMNGMGGMNGMNGVSNGHLFSQSQPQAPPLNPNPTPNPPTAQAPMAPWAMNYGQSTAFYDYGGNAGMHVNQPPYPYANSVDPTTMGPQGAAPMFNAGMGPLAAPPGGKPAPSPKNGGAATKSKGGGQYCQEVKPPKPAGNGKICKFEGCSGPSVGRSPYCSQHTGSRRCQFEGCTKCAQGSTNYCIAHGGGRRCTFPGCLKGARDKFFCAAHGGGKRCTFAGCTKSAVGGSTLCTAHGGGKRCSVPGCTKSSQSKTMLCVRHGGGRKCAVAGCTKVSRGRTDYCAAHGGGVRCRVDTCNKAAVGKYQLCRTHHSAITGEKVAFSPPGVKFPSDDQVIDRKDSGGITTNSTTSVEEDDFDFDYDMLAEEEDEGGIKHLDEMLALAMTQAQAGTINGDLPESEAEKQRVYANEVLAYLQTQQQKQIGTMES